MPSLRRPRRIASLLALVCLAAPFARADTACRAAPSQDCVLAWAHATARAERLEISLRIGAIIQVAAGFVQADRKAEARAIFAEARTLGDSLRPHWAIDGTFVRLAAEQFRAGMREEALALVRGLADPEARAKALREVAAAMREEWWLHEAEALAREIEHAAIRSETLAAAAIGFADSGLVDHAQRAAKTIEDVPQRLRAFAYIAVVLVARESLPDAEKLVREGIALARALGDGRDRAVALGRFAGVLASMRRDEDALALARSIENAELHHLALGPIASAQAKAERIEAALATLNLIDSRHRERNTPVFSRAEAMRDIVEALASADRIDEALALAKSMGNVNNYRTEGFRAIAIAHAKARRFAEAMALARSMGVEGERDDLFRALVPLLTRARRFGDALALAKACYYPFERAPALAGVGAALVEAKRKADADAAFRDALTAAAEMPEGFFRARALVGVALEIPR